MTINSTAAVETFTVIYGGGEIDDSVSLELLDAVSAWSVAAGVGVTCVVEVCAAPWRHLVAGCLAAVVVFGGPVHGLYLPDANDLVAALKLRGVVVRYRRGRQAGVDAELRAISQARPVRYI